METQPDVLPPQQESQFESLIEPVWDRNLLWRGFILFMAARTSLQV